MIGAIAGDVIGSVYEARNVKTKDFPLFSPGSRFTDDTVLTVALAESLLSGRDYAVVLKEYYRRYPDAGYGGAFHAWARSASARPYGSWGNGAAMRVSPAAWVGRSLDEVLGLAAASAAVTHDHPEGIKGAQAVATAVFLARTGAAKREIREQVTRRFGYDLDRRVDAIRPGYRFDVSCPGSVPEALLAFLEATDFEDAVRTAVSLGGDSDTLACIAGAVAEAFYGGVPAPIRAEALARLDEPLRRVALAFAARHGVPVGEHA
jgi:ADP-ribosylglycohydrolase